MGPVGAQEMILIFVVALLLFGPKKLPELGRMLGKALTEFRRAKNELKTTFESHMQELERETRLSEDASKQPSKSAFSSPNYSSPSYPYPYDEYGRNGSYDAGAEPSEIAANPAESRDDSDASSIHPAEPVPGTVPRSNSSSAEPVRIPEEERRPV